MHYHKSNSIHNVKHRAFVSKHMVNDGAMCQIIGEEAGLSRRKHL